MSDESPLSPASDDLSAWVAEQGLRRDTARSLGWLAGWMGTGALVAVGIALAPSLPLRVLGSLCFSFWFVGAGALLHECVHRNVFRARAANVVLGLFAGLLTNLPFGVWYNFHMDHHRFAVTDRDPEGDHAPSSSLASHVFHLLTDYPMFSAYMHVCVVQSWFGVFPPWIRTPRQQWRTRWLGAAHVAALLLAVGAAAAAPWGELVVWLYFVPLLALHLFWFPLLLTSEHYGLTGQGPYETRTVRTHPLLQAMFWNTNFHAEHHAAPQVPSYHLPAVHARIAEQVLVQDGYLAFHAGLVRGLRR